MRVLFLTQEDPLYILPFFQSFFGSGTAYLTCSTSLPICSPLSIAPGSLPLIRKFTDIDTRIAAMDEPRFE